MPSRLSYQPARDLLLISGLVVIGLTVLVMLVRGVDPVEVVATLFFAPIFVGLLFFGLRGGAVLAVAAAVAYVALRWPAISLVGFPALAGNLASRIVGYLAFGVAGGWAASAIHAALDKLELLDDVDEATGLGNARSAVAAIDREKTRADRYRGVFSVTVAEVSGWSPDSRSKALSEMGTRLAASVRSVDHASHVAGGDRHVFVLVLPETGHDGASVVAENLAGHLATASGVEPQTSVATYPGDDDAIDALEARLRRLAGPGQSSGGGRMTMSPT